MSLMIVVVAIAFAGLASLCDLRTGRVPDRLVLSTIALGGVLALVVGGPHGLALSLAGCAVGFATLLPAGLAGVLGGGDIKFAAAIGALLGPGLGFLAAVIGALFAGLVLGVAALLTRARSPRRSLPVIPCLAAAAVLVALMGRASLAEVMP